ncbi:hypothetical protein [Endozoicomonas sp. ALB032]|uniref:hypothetical protein n=1 Tax=Endozoicomonas sp. ALB032 TaxID=3403082 RepID=UPI003BB6DDCA
MNRPFLFQNNMPTGYVNQHQYQPQSIFDELKNFKYEMEAHEKHKSTLDQIIPNLIKIDARLNRMNDEPVVGDPLKVAREYVDTIVYLAKFCENYLEQSEQIASLRSGFIDAGLKRCNFLDKLNTETLELQAYEFFAKEGSLWNPYTNCSAREHGFFNEQELDEFFMKNKKCFLELFEEHVSLRYSIQESTLSGFMTPEYGTLVSRHKDVMELYDNLKSL